MGDAVRGCETMPERSLDLDILSYLANADAAVGVVALHQALHKRHRISQATLGRRLLDLDRRGLTVRQSNQGRLLTAEGRAHVQELMQKTLKRQESDAFLHSLSGDSVEVLLEVLVARRALEREVARIAARRITDADLAELWGIIDRQEQALTQGSSGSQEDLRLHTRLGEIAGNRVLQTALRLVRQQSQLTSLFAFIRYSRGPRVVSDHRRLVSALQTRDPAAAALAMEEHIDNLITSVEAYFRST